MRETLIRWLAQTLRVPIHVGQPDFDAELRRVDPLLAGELAAGLAPELADSKCPICGRELKTRGGCSVSMDFAQGGVGRTPRLHLSAFCYGMPTPDEAIERLVYWLKVRIPRPELEEVADA